MTQLERATKFLASEGRGAAACRAMIKRTLRKMRCPVPVVHRDGAIDQGACAELAGFFLAHPWALTPAIEHAIRASISAYERGDLLRENQYTEDVELLMSLLNVRLTWPGLYPTYVYDGPIPAAMMARPGSWGREQYTLAGLWALLKDIRATEAQAVQA